MPMTDIERTTTLPAGAKPFGDWIASDSGKNEYTDSVFISPTKLEEMSIEDMERFITEWQESYVSHTPGSLVFVTTDTSLTKNSKNGSTGPSPVEEER